MGLYVRGCVCVCVQSVAESRRQETGVGRLPDFLTFPGWSSFVAPEAPRSPRDAETARSVWGASRFMMWFGRSPNARALSRCFPDYFKGEVLRTREKFGIKPSPGDGQCLKVEVAIFILHVDTFAKFINCERLAKFSYFLLANSTIVPESPWIEIISEQTHIISTTFTTI